MNIQRNTTTILAATVAAILLNIATNGRALAQAPDSALIDSSAMRVQVQPQAMAMQLLTVSLPSISYTVPSTLTGGVAVNYPVSNTGGATYADGDATYFAGSGVQGTAEGTGTAAGFYWPAGIVADASGNVYVTDNGTRIRKVTPAGVTSTFAGSTVSGYQDGTGSAARMWKPNRLAIDGSGNLYFTDRGNNRIRRITPSGAVTTLAGSGTAGFVNGTGTAAQFHDPAGIAVDGSGNVYVCDEWNQALRKVTPAGVVTTLATGFSYPKGAAVDASGNIYVANYSSGQVTKVTPSGTKSTFASGLGHLLNIWRLADGSFLTVSAEHRIHKLSSTGTVTVFAGTGSAGSANGAPLSASFNAPEGICTDASGNIYVADSQNHRIRRMGTGQGYSISPALPAGLVLDRTTGTIGGTPTVTAPTTTYTITAHNAAGDATTTVTFSVTSPSALSSDRNYIHTTTYLEAFAAPPAAPAVTEAMQDVTYYDGLGRPEQVTNIKATPSAARDVVIPIAYDAYGREDRKYLPYATATGAGGAYKASAITAQAAYYNTPPTGVVAIPAVSGTTPSFARTVFEASPLNRVLEQGAPGQVWQPATSRTSTTGRTVAMEYTANDEAAFTMVDTMRRVALYRVSLAADGTPTLTLASGAIYAKNQLYVTVTKDENWAGGSGTFASRLGTTEEYRDKQGRVVLKRTFNVNKGVNEVLSTYYVYDDFGNLTYVLTPGGTPDRATLPTGTALADWLARYAYQYRYDERNRLVEKQVPSRGREYIIYNRLDQVVATQTANQRARAPQEWTVTKYDGLGRTALTGLYSYGATANASYRTVLQDSAYSGGQWEVRKGTAGNGYSNLAFPRGTIGTTLTLHYYDDYELPLSPPAAYKPTGYSGMTQGLPTATLTKVLGAGTGTSNMLWTVMHYDKRGDNVRTFSQHYRGGSVSANNYDDITSEYSFTHQLTKTIREHHAGSTSAALTITTEHTYDHRNRPVDTWKKVNSGTRTLVARNGYNEVGQLQTKRLHSTSSGSSFAQNIAYTYNERGWLRTVNGELFDEQLLYNTGTSKYYNGNIAYQVFSRKHTDNTTVSGTYSYTYDKLNRLASGTMAGGRGREGIGYDLLGNITALDRRNSAGNTADSLLYTYNARGQLSSVNDRAADGSAAYQLAGTTAYTYDANGNVLTRKNTAHTARDITATTYNHLDLPQTVTAQTGAISYTYDATGRKLRSVNGGQVRDYIDGIEYAGTVLDFVRMEEGRIVNSGGTYHYEYELRDHLGNTRSGFEGTTATATASNIGSDYYPFGLQYQSKIAQPSPKNNYLYNGKELQEGTGLYDYGARFYDPVIGRWGSVDPITDLRPDISSYTYCVNNPILYIDQFGLDSVSAMIYLKEVVVTAPKLGAILSPIFPPIDNVLKMANDWTATKRDKYQAENFIDLAYNATRRNAKASVVKGDLLNRVKNDPAFKAWRKKIIAQYKSNPLIKKYSKSFKLGGNKFFSLEGDTELKLSIRGAWINASFVESDGTTTINYSIDDTFDIRPQEGRGPIYNGINGVLEPIWVGFFHGNEDMKVEVRWNETITE